MTSSFESAGAADVSTDSQKQPSAAVPGATMDDTSANREWFAMNSRARENQQNLPDLTIDEFLENVPRVLSNLDLDKDGTVDRFELSKAVDDPYIKGHDAQVVGAIYSLQKRSRNSNEPAAYDAPLEKINVAQAKDQIKMLMDVGDRDNKDLDNKLDFASVDTDGNSIITRTELENSKNNDPDAKPGVIDVALKYYQKREDEALLKGTSYEGMTKKEVDTLNSVMTDANLRAELIVKYSIEDTGKMQRSEKSAEAFADKDNPLNSISADAINQGEVGNCWFESVLASLADKRKETIRDMIEDFGDGGYKVTFPGDKDNPVFVTNPSDINISKFNNTNESGSWPNIIEKAFGKYMIQQRFLPMDQPDASGSDKGGDPAEAIRLLTGHDAKRDDITDVLESGGKSDSRWLNKQAKIVSTWLDEGRTIIVGTPRNVADNKFDIEPNHALTVMSHFEKDGKTSFVVRDPWGKYSQVKDNRDGVFTIESDDFFKTFPRIAIESK